MSTWRSAGLLDRCGYTVHAMCTVEEAAAVAKMDSVQLKYLADAIAGDEQAMSALANVDTRSATMRLAEGLLRQVERVDPDEVEKAFTNATRSMSPSTRGPSLSSWTRPTR